MNDPQFTIHNTHLESVDVFERRDPQLKALGKQKYVYQPPLLAKLPKDVPGIYTISGGRQIGKTTLSKQWMLVLLEQGVTPESIAYFTGETIVDHLSLIRQLQTHLGTMPQDSMRYVIVDEVTYIINWDMGVKFLADAGLLENVVLIITGSDLAIIQEARMRFPGRRGKAGKVDFHVYPLSFYEVLQLTNAIDNVEEELRRDTPSEVLHHQVNETFNDYLKHGGYLTAINDFAQNSNINKSILDTYSDWIRGDVIKHGKSNHHCVEFFTAMINRLGSQVTWTNLAKEFSTANHVTIASYAELLESMDVIFVQQALIEDKLVGAVKKARKLIFTDPFIYHAIYCWLNSCEDPFHNQILPAINDPIISSYLVECCVASHYHRWYPTYYVKAEGEIDIAYVKNKKFWPVEVKWRNQVRSKDLKQIQKYPNGIVLGKQSMVRPINSIMSYPLAWYLAKLSFEHFA